jgi:hypothetical protein
MMKQSNVCYLIHENKTQDDKGVWHSNEVSRKVFCKVSSIGQKEWFEGGRSGLNPSLKVTMFAYDYSDEEIVAINEKRYTVYRTYQPSNDTIELYLELKKGKADGKTI